MPRMLKPSRFLTRAALAALATGAVGFSASAASEPLVRSLADPGLEWGACPEFMPEGCALAVLQGNPAEPNADILFQLPGGSTAPRHWHNSPERMVLLTGRMEVDYDGHPSRTAGAGDYLYGPARLPHVARCVSEEACTLFIAFQAPVDAMAGAPADLTQPAVEAQNFPYRGEGHVMIVPDQLEWGAVPSMAPPARIAVIEGDLSSAEPFIFRLRLPDGYRVHPHTHPAFERVTVVSGTLHFGHGERFDRSAARALGPGSVAIMPPGAPMFGWAEGETVIQVHGTGPWGIEYIDPADDPRR